MEAQSGAMTQEGVAKKSPFDDLSREELILKCKGLLTIAQKAKQSKTELQNEIESYKIALDKCETEKQSSLQNLQTLQELVESLTEQKLNYITEVDSAQAKIKALNNKCKEYENEIENYKADNIIKSKSLSDSAQKLSDFDSEIISLKRQNNRLLEENEQLINQLGELEAQIEQFNKIGLEQRKQLEILEERLQSEETNKIQINVLNKKIEELEHQLNSNVHNDESVDINKLESKIKELTNSNELEKSKNEKANIKLRSYKDKILKCAACINQLKNSRFILTKTIQDYSENIPKWQNDIIKASKLLENQITHLNNENINLREKLDNLEQQMLKMTESQNEENKNIDTTELNIEISVLNKKVNELEQLVKLENENCEKYKAQVVSLNSNCESLQSQIHEIQEQASKHFEENVSLRKELDSMSAKYTDLRENQLPTQVAMNNQLTTDLNDIKRSYDKLKNKNKELTNMIEKLKSDNDSLTKSNQKTSNDKEMLDNLNLQIRALESEKATLVKEKLNARDNVVELENRNKILTDQNNKLKSEILSTQSQLDTVTKEKIATEKRLKTEKESEFNNVKCEMLAIQEQYDLLKKEHENLQDLNGLLKEEVETLKLSLEQPRPDDGENGSDLNVSLQADVVKLETKLAAYKQENASLLAEIKESRAKMKEYDNLVAECEDAKSKLTGYKTENTELLNEMKEINQVLKERGEAISKLQKAIAEMERLVETLEKDRENINQEKADLQHKITGLENELKNAEQNTNQTHKDSEQVLLEKDAAFKTLAEKEIIINSLKEENERLKQQQSSSDLPNEDMSTSTISKAEEHSRMKDLDESFEEKYTKLRLFALKLKKKLNDTVNQLQNAEQDKAKLEKLLNENEKAQLPASKDEVDSSKVLDLQTKVKTLTESVAASENIAAEVERLKGELETKANQLAAEVEAHKVTKENLEKARRDAKKKNVLSLEMEDYERSMKELTAKMEEKKKKMVQMESIIDTQEGTLTAMKTQIKLLEEQIRSEETQNRLSKEELQNALEESREKDNIIQTKNETITKLEQDLEDEKRKNEEAILEITSVLGEKQKCITSLGEEKIELNNKVKKLEYKCAEMCESLRIANIELADLKTEYTSYKVRAQAVLRQNQTVDHSQEEQLKEEAAALRSQIETLTAKLTTSQDQCAELTAELEATRRRASEGANEVARAQQRTARLQADLARLSHELDSERSQHKLQVSTLTQCYKTQINELEARLQKETELRKQLPTVQDNAKSVAGVVTSDDANRNQFMLQVIPKDDSDGEMDINVSMIPREEGEGSESAPTPPPSKSYMASAGSGRSPVPLDRLLEHGVPEDEAMDAASLALTPEQEILDLRRRLQAQQQRVKHVTVLLAESERECARMAQLSDLLKSELRRAHGSTQSAHNAEYMKNVTLKFLTLPPGDERSRLVPVLQKILALSPEDTNKLQAVAKGMDPNPNKGWGSYLPWPGGK